MSVSHEKVSEAVYVLVIKEKNLDALGLYLDNLESLGLYIETVPGITVDVLFINVSISDTALKHFSELYEIGQDRIPSDSPFMFKRIFASPFTTPVSQLPPRKEGILFNFEVVMIVNKVLEATKYNHRTNDNGISRLISSGILLDAYPLHDGPATLNGYNDRSLLLRYWSNMASAHREQPLDLIHRYFGPEIALYFAWLEYFNIMLAVPSILGAVVFIIGLVRVSFLHMHEVEEICNDNERYVCPTCERRPHCKFPKLRSFCSMSQWTYVFDNDFTVAFAVFMSFWATLFLTLWIRTENKLKLRWNAPTDDLMIDEGKIREVYYERAKRRRYNPDTAEIEPYVPAIQNTFNCTISFLVCVIVIAIMLMSLGLNITAGIEFRSLVDEYGTPFFKTNKLILSIMLAAIIQVIYIQLMSLVFGPLSIKLTNLENPPSQSRYDNSVLYKRYLLAFVNTLSPLFYLAFVKGKLYEVPHKNSFYFVQDVCQPQSCIVPLCIQLTFLLTLRSFAGNVVNLIIPNVKWVCRKIFRIKKVETNILPQWEEEYFLEPSGRYLLTSEFSEMIIKYCMVTFFVGAFPLAPLCALINNLLELRSDAYKLVQLHRRPVPVRKTSIGAWNGILLSMTYTSTATNAFVIAFTSDFIPDKIYHFVSDIENYYDYILSVYATRDYPAFNKLENSVEYCMYRGHYNPPESTEAYQTDEYFWLNITAKCISILIFEHVVLICNTVMSYLIPKVPESVEHQLTMERYKEREIVIQDIDAKIDKDKVSVSQILKI